MKLLLDQNLSPRLCDRLPEVWTDLVHVRAVGPAAGDDLAGWAYARQLTIVSKDGDFSALLPVRCAAQGHLAGARQLSTSEIERRLRGHHQEIKTFVTEPDATLLVIEPGQSAGAT